LLSGGAGLTVVAHRMRVSPAHTASPCCRRELPKSLGARKGTPCQDTRHRAPHVLLGDEREAARRTSE
jgi:hypothetical protein